MVKRTTDGGSNDSGPLLKDSICIDSDELAKEIDSLNCCCIAGGESGCVLKMFPEESSNQFVDARNYVAAIRHGRSVDNDFVMKSFRPCIKGISSGDKQPKLILEYCVLAPIVSSSVLAKESYVPVCRDAFKVVYGITQTELRKASSFIRNQHTEGVKLPDSAFNHTAWTDSFIQPYTFAEGETIVNSALRTTVAGKCSLCHS